MTPRRDGQLFFLSKQASDWLLGPGTGRRESTREREQSSYHRKENWVVEFATSHQYRGDLNWSELPEGFDFVRVTRGGDNFELSP
jgi:hypothetical protein